MTEIEEKQLQTLIKAAHAGGEVLRSYFGKTLNIKEKSTVADFQTEADLGSEKAILTIIKSEFPQYNILSEEDGETENNSEYTVVIDPLDGTNNFVLGIPHFSVSIGLLCNGEAIAGVVYQPILNKTFTAFKGNGAFMNDKKIKVSNVVDIKNLTTIYTVGYIVNRDYLSKIIGSLYASNCKRIINNWSAAFELCMLASGKVESFISDGLEIHDFAAGKLIAIEAGAKVVDLVGNKDSHYLNTYFVASNTNEVNRYILNIIEPFQSLTK